jgi:DNA sulfur modification protein DndE
MSAPIEHIRLSQQAKDQLLRLKRKTGIQHWNVLCRWAFCISLAEPGVPPPAKIPADSSVEMTWKVFGGVYSDIYLALLKQRCQQRIGLDVRMKCWLLSFACTCIAASVISLPIGRSQAFRRC